MKILMLTPYLPYPLISGGQIRTYNLLKNLSKGHKITLFSYIRSQEEEKYKKELLKYCKNVYLIKRRRAWALKNILLAGFTPYPFLVCLYLSQGLKNAINETLKREKFDLVHAETFYIMPQLAQSKLPIFLVEQTIEWLVYQHYTQEVKNPLLKPFLWFDVAKIKFWEKYFWKKANKLAAVSEEDRQIIGQTVNIKNIEIVANGVDVDFFSKTGNKKDKTKTVLFVGNFKWLPNSDAALFLVNKIWPKILDKYKNAQLWIVGKNPTEKILALEKSKNVLVKSDIEDIRDAFSQADVMLAPIRNGRGTKYKVLEAIATRTPVVATPLAVEGLNISDGKEVLVGKTAEELAEKTASILENSKLGETLAKRAYMILKNKYNWETISKELDNIYREIGGK